MKNLKLTFNDKKIMLIAILQALADKSIAPKTDRSASTLEGRDTFDIIFPQKYEH